MGAPAKDYQNPCLFYVLGGYSYVAEYNYKNGIQPCLILIIKHKQLACLAND